MKKKLIIALVIIIVASIAIYKYTYKEHRNISTEKPDFEVTVLNLQEEFKNNDSLANKKYLDKTIEIYGKITNIDLASNAIVVDEKLFANFKDKIQKKFEVGKTIKVKGRFLGYDDLLDEFKIDQADEIE